MTTKHTKDSAHDTSSIEADSTTTNATTKGKTMTTKTKKTAGSPGTTNVGLAALVKELSATMDEAEAALGPSAPATTASEKRRRSKPRKGSEKVFSLLAPIVQQNGLESASLSAEAMMARNQTAETLIPLQTRLERMTKRVSDEVFDAQTDAWDMGLQFYALLQRRAKTDGTLAENLEPIAKVFSYRHASTTVDKPSKEETKARAALKKAQARAAKHGIALPEATGTGAGAAVQAAPVAAAPQAAGAAVVAAPVMTAPAVTPVVTPAAVMPGASVAAAATPVAAESAAPAQVNASPAQVAVGAGAAGSTGANGANGAPVAN